MELVAKTSGLIDFRSCGQALEHLRRNEDIGGGEILLAECARRPELGVYTPSDWTFEACPEWEPQSWGYTLRNMRVMILGIDGYLGWSLALWLASRGFQVGGIDNFGRRKWTREVGAGSVVPIQSMKKRLRAARRQGLSIEFHEGDICDLPWLTDLLRGARPESIVHYAECPSAPYSMIDAEHAIEVQRNNVLGTLGLLFAMRDIVPESALVKLATMGEYGTPLTGRPLFEGVFPADAVLSWDDRKWSMGGEITPRDPASFYHVSKVQDTFNVYEACKYWWLRSHDIMQGVIYGVLNGKQDLDTRLDIDQCFGTIINRFVAQAVIGMPLTVYGAGHQLRGLIALQDAMDCMTRLIVAPPEPGQYNVVNQMSGYHSILDLARTVARVGRQEFGLDVQIQRVENPRVEAEQHLFEPIYDKLPRQYGFERQVALDDGIRRLFRKLVRVRGRIARQRRVLMPSTRWSGLHRTSEILEDIN